jgi:hypothetical protein
MTSLVFGRRLQEKVGRLVTPDYENAVVASRRAPEHLDDIRPVGGDLTDDEGALVAPLTAPIKSSRFFNAEMQRFFKVTKQPNHPSQWLITTQYWTRPSTLSIPIPGWRVSSFTNARALR